MQNGKLILLLFEKIWIDRRIQKFEVDTRTTSEINHSEKKRDPPTYRGGGREKSGCETCAMLCILQPHTTEGRIFLNVSLNRNILRILWTFWNRLRNNPKDGHGCSRPKNVGHFEVF